MKKMHGTGIKFVILALLFALVFFGSFWVGRYDVSPLQTLRILADWLLRTLSRGRLALTQTWQVRAQAVVLNVRLPRVAAAALAMVLAGVMISSLFTSGTSFIKLVADPTDQLPAITYWLMGSLTATKARDVQFAAWPILAGLVPLWLLRWRVNLLTVSETEARSMGVHTGRLRVVVVLCATLIPHFGRMIFGQDYRKLLPASSLLSAVFLMVVDDLARTVTTSEIPLGILTSFVGAPVFLYLILSGGTQREH